MKLFKNKGILLCIILVLMLLFFHTYYWADFYSITPTDQWSRPQAIGTSFYNRPPVVTSDHNKNVTILYDLEEDIEIAKLHSQGEVVYKEQIESPYVQTDRVKKKILIEDQFIWQEGDILYKASFSDKEKSFGDRGIVQKEIVDFEVMQDERLLMVAKEKEIQIFDLEQSEQIYSLKVKNKIQKIALSNDEQGNINIAYSLQRDSITDDIYVLQLKRNKEGLKPIQNTLVHTIEYMHKYKMGELDITSLGEELYIWYTQNKWDARGAEAWVYYIHFPNIESLENEKAHRIELPVLWEKESQYTTKIHPVANNGSVDLYLASEWADTRRENGNDIFVVHFHKGEMEEYQRITSTDFASNHPIILSNDSDRIMIWSDVKGSQKFEVNMASTNPQMIEKLSGTTKNDWTKGLGISLMGLSYALLYTVTRIMYQIPVMAIFAFVEFFDIHRWKERKYLLMGIGWGFYNIIKIITFDFYYRPFGLEIMPQALQFSGYLWIIPLVTSLISAVPILIYDREKSRKGDKMSAFVLAIFFVVFDILFTSLIYTPFLVD